MSSPLTSLGERPRSPCFPASFQKICTQSIVRQVEFTYFPTATDLDDLDKLISANKGKEGEFATERVRVLLSADPNVKGGVHSLSHPQPTNERLLTELKSNTRE
jgi:hypothetical protein